MTTDQGTRETVAPMEIEAGRKLADWLRERGDTNYAALVDRLTSAAELALRSGGEGWQDISTAPKDGTHFLVHYIDLVDEYDEDDRLIARAVPTASIGVAHKTDIFGLMDVPYQGRIVQGRRYTAWHALPPLSVYPRGGLMHPKLTNPAVALAGIAALALSMSADLGSQPYGQHHAERLSKPRPKKKRKFKGSRAAKRGHPS